MNPLPADYEPAVQPLHFPAMRKSSCRAPARYPILDYPSRRYATPTPIVSNWCGGYTPRMFLTTHAAAGIALSRVVDDPLTLFGLAVASHFVMDFIPHGDENLYHDNEWKIQKRYRRALSITAVDLTLLTLLVLWAVTRAEAPGGGLLMVGILGSLIPDLLTFFFPVIHERMSWLWLVRWIYALTKPTGLRYVARAQDWLHQTLHHNVIRSDVPLVIGVATQIGLVVALLALVP